MILIWFYKPRYRKKKKQTAGLIENGARYLTLLRAQNL